MLFEALTAGAEWLDENVPCTRACPVLTQAGRYATAIAASQDDLAYLTARMPNPFPSICGRICAAPCEPACRRALIDEPVAIRALKRFACSVAGVESAAGDRLWREAVRRRRPRDEQVAVIGSGPAGLACAHDLAAYGYRPVVFEARDRPGGMMILGIPTYRLPRHVIETEIRAILDLGVELRTGTAFGWDVDLSSLRDQGFAAVFLAAGAMRSRDLAIPGVEQDGVLRAVDFLINANLGYQVELGDRVAVIGGGNVALDVARTALRELAAGRLPGPTSRSAEDGVRAAATVTFDAARAALRMGAREVMVVALEARHEMPATAFEIAEAEGEGIRILHRLGPKAILGSGRVTGVETLQVASVFDPDGRFNPRFVSGTEEEIACDSVILAIGQTPDLSWLRPEDGVQITPRGTIDVDPRTLATTAPRVFAGGDVAFGPRNLIEAVADGRRAATAIHGLLTGELTVPLPPPRASAVPRVERPVLDYDAVPRVEVPAVPTGRRVGATEVELGYEPGQARLEANRCLRCFLDVWLDPHLCILCGGCVDVCPERCLRIVPTEAVSGLAVDQPAGALVIQEDRCIRCALCVERCPTGALSMIDWAEASLQGGRPTAVGAVR